MRKLFQKIRGYFKLRKDYKLLEKLVVKNCTPTDLEDCYILITQLSTFRKHGYILQTRYSSQTNEKVPVKAYPKFNYNGKTQEFDFVISRAY